MYLLDYLSNTLTTLKCVRDFRLIVDIHEVFYNQRIAGFPPIHVHTFTNMFLTLHRLRPHFDVPVLFTHSYACMMTFEFICGSSRYKHQQKAGRCADNSYACTMRVHAFDPHVPRALCAAYIAPHRRVCVCLFISMRI